MMGDRGVEAKSQVCCW